ncbi:hypothetical protein DFQ28_009753 [Apophysomyces sp. BC1034]|nr:hypothetical protein DFQ30_005933 [Apophysomyces sp. BC1015]KAG0182333.1 hypothetical protein DFQ29_004573 [Apophysomyces sp. BC1021]KAG0194546.1 hypothetical protein DFQ28_009753 [Apophysomyces sp. BC1034]
MVAFDPRRRSISGVLWMLFILAVSLARAQDTASPTSTAATAPIPSCSGGGNCSSAVVNATSTLNSTSSTSVTTATASGDNSTSTIASVTPTNSIFTSMTSPITYMPIPTVNPTGWNGNTNTPPPNNESWLKQHNRFVFVIVIGLLLLALIIWYIVKSVRGMQKRLERENQAQILMMQQATGGARIIPESEGYKMDTLPPPAQASSSPPRY